MLLSYKTQGCFRNDMLALPLCFLHSVSLIYEQLVNQSKPPFFLRFKPMRGNHETKRDFSRAWHQLHVRVVSSSNWFLTSSTYYQLFAIRLPTYPSPNLKFCPKREVSVNVRFGEGQVGSFQESDSIKVFKGVCSQ